MAVAGAGAGALVFAAAGRGAVAVGAAGLHALILESTNMIQAAP